MAKEIKFALFKIGEEDFGIDINRVVEILHSQKIYSLPELPDFLSGVIMVRNQIIPLLDLRKRFGTRSTEGKELIIITRYDSEKIGIVVEEVHGIISLKEEDIMSPPTIFKGLKSKYLTGLARKNEKIIILLNLDYLLTSEEKIMLQQTEGIIEDDKRTGTLAEG